MVWKLIAAMIAIFTFVALSQQALLAIAFGASVVAAWESVREPFRALGLLDDEVDAGFDAVRQPPRWPAASGPAARKPFPHR